MARKPVEQSGVVGDDGERLSARMRRLNLKNAELQRLSGVDRQTIAAIRSGAGFRRESLSRLEAVLSEMEQEKGLGEIKSAEETVEFEVRLPGESEATVVVRGPGAEEAVARLLRRLQQPDN